MPVRVLANLLPFQLSANISWDTEEDGSSACARATHMGNLGGVPGFDLIQLWLLHAFWECTSRWRMEDLSLSLSLSLCLPLCWSAF